MSDSPRDHPHEDPVPAVDPRLPRTFGAVLRLPFALYARHPFALLAATALPLLPGQVLETHLRLRETDGARVVDGELLAPPERSETTPLGPYIELAPGWPADAVTLLGWILGVAAGSLVAAALLLGRRLPLRDAARAALFRLPLLLVWTFLLLGALAVTLFTVGMGAASVLSLSPGLSSEIPGAVLWPPTALVALSALAALLVGLPIALLRDLTLSEAISAAWLLGRGRRIAYLLFLVPLAVLLSLPAMAGEHVADAATGTGASLGAALGVKVLLVLFLAPLPALLLTGQALWTRPVPGPVGRLSEGSRIADRLDRLGATTEVPAHRPAAAAACTAVLVLIPLAGAGGLWTNPHGTPGTSTERLDRSEFERLAGDGGPAPGDPRATLLRDEEARTTVLLACPDAEPDSKTGAACEDPVERELVHGWGGASVIVRSDGRPLVADRDEEVRLLDCRDPVCSEWDTVLLGGGPANNRHGPPDVAVDGRDRPRVAFVDGRSGLLTFLACTDPACLSRESVELLAPSDVPVTAASEHPSGTVPVRVLSLGEGRPELLLGHTRVTCSEPLCGLPGA